MDIVKNMEISAGPGHISPFAPLKRKKIPRVTILFTSFPTIITGIAFPYTTRLCHDNGTVFVHSRSNIPANMAWSSNIQNLVLKSYINTDVLYKNFAG
jgi:hypothetical protein